MFFWALSEKDALFLHTKTKRIIMSMSKSTVKHIVLMLCLLMPSIWCAAAEARFEEGVTNITIKESKVSGHLKGSDIHASIHPRACADGGLFREPWRGGCGGHHGFGQPRAGAFGADTERPAGLRAACGRLHRQLYAA